MSLHCPLCGKSKLEEVLFCDDCSRKIKSDYEVDIPETYSQRPIEPNNIPEKDSLTKSETETFVTAEPEIVENTEPETYIPPVAITEEEKPVHTVSKRKKRGKVIWWIVLIVAILIASFLFYGQTVREGNLERAGWDAAVKQNTVESYLTYMERFPKGVHYAEADSNLRVLKSSETSAWEKMRSSDNTAELRDFIRSNPDSHYNPLIKNRLDSLSWIGALKQNTAESYSEYMMLSQSGEFNGDYFSDAQERHDMLFQSYPVNAGELDSIKISIAGFYRAISSLSYEGVTTYLAPTVNRFFNSGTAPRDRIIGELMVAGAQSQTSTMKFSPNMEALQYEKTYNNSYKANVPLVKTYKNNGKDEEVSGYIVHAELNSAFQIVSIFETKPFNDAP